jgi:arylformamidase
MRIYDISRPITAQTLLHPGDPPMMHVRSADVAKGKDYNLSLVTMGIHTGTHYDFPRHFDETGPAMQDFPPERFMVDAHVVDCGDADAVKPEHLTGVAVQPGDAVLLKTKNGAVPQEKMLKEWVYVTPEAAQRCVELGCGIVGMDYIEVENPQRKGERYPVHETLLGNGVLLLENIDLREVPAGKYRLIALPLLMPGLEAAQCRAVLLGDSA